MPDDVALPAFADTVVIGAGTAGAAVAGALAERADQSVLLLEAGPDYGARDSGRWPAELLDARALPTSHAWGYDSGAAWSHRTLACAPAWSAAARRTTAAPRSGAAASTTTGGPRSAIRNGRPTSCCRSSVPAPSACACAAIAMTRSPPFRRPACRRLLVPGCRW